MTSVKIRQEQGRPIETMTQRRGTLRTLLLACGIFASLLYIATDILGGLRYEGYSFISQAISELAAFGAPSKPFVDPLFTAYGVLALVFALGVLVEAGRNRALRTAGALLAAHAVLGLTAPASSAMHERGSIPVEGDLAHIVLTAGIVILLLAAIGFGAAALGRRFRIYSIVTLLTVIALTAATAPYAMRLAAGKTTPGFGIVERIDVYALMAWLAVLAIALLRRPALSRAAAAITKKAHVDGMVAPGFEEVRAEFERNFAERGEIGAAVAAYWHGEKVVDLWGGSRTLGGKEPWKEDTMAVVMSTTKGLSAMTLAVANARGWLDYDAPVSRYWPEFGQNGKGAITVRQLLAHEAGLVLLDKRVSVEQLRDLGEVARILARQKPAWPPGTRHGYHTMTLGLYMQEIIRRADPAHRTLGRFFRDEIAAPLGLDFYIGLPREIPNERLARMKTLSRVRGLLALFRTPFAVTMKMLVPGSLLRRSMVGIENLDWNDRRSFDVELPSGNGVGTARAIARAYSAFAEGGGEIGITPETFARLTEPPVVARPRDEVIGLPSYFSLGFMRPGPGLPFGSTAHAFGTPGAGGSFAFADPDAQVGYAYVMNKMDFYLLDDPREKALRDGVYRAITRLTDRREREHDAADLTTHDYRLATSSQTSAIVNGRGAFPSMSVNP